MSHLKYYAYEGFGVAARERYGFSQAVRVGDRIECAGQGGSDPKTFEFPSTIAEEIEQAFANCDMNLRDAGGKGCEQVFRVNSYHLVLDEEALKVMKGCFEKWMPNHAPIWTCVEVKKLGDPRMRVEIEVVAHDPK